MKEFDRLIEIIRRLRDPEKGCPWDVKQTHSSLIPNFIEELYEVIEAIEHGDFEHLSEELGDLLLHIVMQVQIAVEKDLFDMSQVLNKINDKLVRRHPHIFGDGPATDAKGVKLNWERIKQEEKKGLRKSAIDGIPLSMPALVIAQRMQEKAASVGFDWQNAEPVLEKLHEEIDELKSALIQEDSTEISNELGDVLFTVVNLSRKLENDAESCLRKSIRKFSDRFHKIEEYHHRNKEDINQSSMEKLDEIWNNTKKRDI